MKSENTRTQISYINAELQLVSAVSRPVVGGHKVACVLHTCKDIAPFTMKSHKILNEKHLHHYKLRVKVNALFQ